MNSIFSVLGYLFSVRWSYESCLYIKIYSLPCLDLGVLSTWLDKKYEYSCPWLFYS